jgi:NAD(P)H-dependent FMN reductase
VRFLVLYGSYRRDRLGIRLARYCVTELGSRGHDVELIDAQAVGLPMLDRRLKEYPDGQAPANMVELGRKIEAADGFLFVTGEYNWGVQPGLKNLTDHYLEEWYWRPAAIASYSLQRIAGARSGLAWHGTLSEMGMVVVSSSIAVGQIDKSIDENDTPIGDGGAALARAFPRFAADFEWWAEAGKAQRALKAPPY